MMRPIIVYAPPYSADIGGIIWLHKLCHLLNQIGYEAYLFPAYHNHEINAYHYKESVINLAKDLVKKSLIFKPFKLNKNFNTPVINYLNLNKIINNAIVIYAENITGNPLNADYVARYFLHAPGYFNKKAYFGFNEFHIRGGSVSDNFNYPFCKTYSSYLDLSTIPWELYLKEANNTQRNGIAYSIRKGIGKKIIHNLHNSILIDGLSHKEISEVFKSVKTFISYDVNSAYSQFAAIAGCDSIVIPDDCVDKEGWRSDPGQRYGIAYGIAKHELREARRTRDQLIERLKKIQAQQAAEVQNMTSEMFGFFNEPRYSYFR